MKFLNSLGIAVGMFTMAISITMIFVILIGWLCYYGKEFMVPCYWIFGISTLATVIVIKVTK